MSNVIEMPLDRAAVTRIEGGYQTEWSNMYSAQRSLVDRQTAIELADAHVAYLKKRDADVLAGVRMQS